MWDLANRLHADYDGLPPNSIQEAVLTCWWSVTAARTTLKHWKQWRKFAEDIVNATKTDTKTGKISRDLIGLMLEPKLYLDLLFIVGFWRPSSSLSTSNGCKTITSAQNISAIEAGTCQSALSLS
jgi:hypothetical protein